MALIQCRECQAEIFSEARACPKCGAVPAVAPSRPRWRWWNVVVVLGIGCFIWYLVQGGVDIRQCQSAMVAARSAGMPAGEELPRLEPEHRVGPPNRMTCVAAAGADLYQITYDSVCRSLNASCVQLTAVVRASDGQVLYPK